MVGAVVDIVVTVGAEDGIHVYGHCVAVQLQIHIIYELCLIGIWCVRGEHIAVYLRLGGDYHNVGHYAVICCELLYAADALAHDSHIRLGYFFRQSAVFHEIDVVALLFAKGKLRIGLSGYPFIVPCKMVGDICFQSACEAAVEEPFAAEFRERSQRFVLVFREAFLFGKCCDAAQSYEYAEEQQHCHQSHACLKITFL